MAEEEEEEEVEEGRSSSSAILDLPEPLLLHILSFLTDVRSRHRAALACGRMRAAERATRALTTHPSAAAALTHLDLGLAAATDGFKSSELGPIAASCPNLRKLVAPCLFNPRFSDCVGDDALLSLATSCPRLTVLRLSEPFEAAANIQREEAAITVAGLVAFFAALPALEDFTMDLQHNVLEAAPAMEALARRCQRIKFLTLGSFQGLCKASWLHLDGVAVCGGLESLYMKNCQDLTDASLAAIGRGCRRLAKFGIHGCDLVTSAGIRRLAFALRPTLKEVTVLHCRLLHTAECLTALSPIRDRIESLEINCVWNTTEQPCSVANGTTTECDPEDDELGEVYESAAKKCRYMEFDDLGSWEMLRSLSLWFSAGQLLSPLISAGLDSCPVLEEISIKTLYELDYWPPQDKDVHHRSLTLPAVGLIQRCVGLRKLFIHGTTHEHFMTFFLSIPNLRDMQLREDYYPAPENDLMFTEMRAESWLRIESCFSFQGTTNQFHQN
uniref:F-box domain-containing protein n=1 Tax=Oryza meridionalis TaxID=40149 RepID=A0A0E0DX42_9ORYZ